MPQEQFEAWKRRREAGDAQSGLTDISRFGQRYNKLSAAFQRRHHIMPEKWDVPGDVNTIEFFQNTADALGLPDEFGIKQREREILDVLTSIFDNNSQFTVNQALGFIDKYLTNDNTHSAQFAMWINNHRQQIAETFSTAVQSKDYNAATTSQDFMNAIYDEANAAILKRVQLRDYTQYSKDKPLLADGLSDAELEDAIKEAERRPTYKHLLPTDYFQHEYEFDKADTVLEGMQFYGKSKDEIAAYLSKKPIVAWLTDEEKEQYSKYIDKDTLDRISAEVRSKLERGEMELYPRDDLDENIFIVKEFLRRGSLEYIDANTAGVTNYAYEVQSAHRKQGLVKLAESIGINCEGATINDIYELIKAKVREAAEVGGITEFPDVSDKTLQIAADVPSDEYKPPEKEKVPPTKTVDDYTSEINSLLDADSHDSESVEKIMRLVEEARTAYPSKRMAHKAASHLGLKKLPTDEKGLHHLPVDEIMKRLRARLEQLASGVVSETTGETAQQQNERSKRGRKSSAEPTEQDFADLADRFEAALSSNNRNDKALDEAIEKICENFKTELKFGVKGLVGAAHRLGLNARDKDSAKSITDKIQKYVRENGVIGLRNYDRDDPATKSTEETTEEFVEET